MNMVYDNVVFIQLFLLFKYDKSINTVTMTLNKIEL